MWIRYMLSRHDRTLAVLMLLMTCNMLMAVEAKLTLNNGKVIHGELVSQSKDTVILNVAGIESRYDTADIKSVEKKLTPNQAYEAKRAQLKDDDLEGRYKLASWLYSEKKYYKQAEKELLSMLKAFPQDTRIPVLLKIVRSKLKLQGKDSSKTSSKRTRYRKPTYKNKNAVPDTKATYQSSVISGADKLLTESQINLLKVYEINLNRRPNVIFKRDDLLEFLKSNVGVDGVPQRKSDRDYFLNRLEGYQQLGVIFNAKARKFYGKARILGEPKVFKTFKIIHRTYILNRCATSACHGGKEARGIYLFTSRPRARPDDIVYTNFYILNSYNAPKAGVQYDMIDRVNPDRSLLLQFGLRPEDAVFPHPPVRQMRPVFLKGPDDAQYQMIHNWIQMLYSPAPDYGIDYTPRGSVKKKIEPESADVEKNVP